MSKHNFALVKTFNILDIALSIPIGDDCYEEIWDIVGNISCEDTDKHVMIYKIIADDTLSNALIKFGGMLEETVHLKYSRKN